MDDQGVSFIDYIQELEDEAFGRFRLRVDESLRLPGQVRASVSESASDGASATATPAVACEPQNLAAGCLTPSEGAGPLDADVAPVSDSGPSCVRQAPVSFAPGTSVIVQDKSQRQRGPSAGGIQAIVVRETANKIHVKSSSFRGSETRPRVFPKSAVLRCETVQAAPEETFLSSAASSSAAGGVSAPTRAVAADNRRRHRQIDEYNRWQSSLLPSGPDEAGNADHLLWMRLQHGDDF